MKLSDLIPPNRIVVLERAPESSRALLESLLAVLWQHSSLGDETVSEDLLLHALLEREAAHPTAIGGGVAFPHARILDLRGEYDLLAVSAAGLDFNSLDQKPVHVILLSLVPRGNPVLLLQSRAAFVRFLNSSGGTAHIRSLTAPAEIWQALADSNVTVDQQILAKDLMQPVRAALTPDQTLRDAARMFHLKRQDSLPVMDGDGRFLGALSCQGLFSLGLPEFFSQLRTISFIRSMNPFERYFAFDQSLTVRDAMKKQKSYSIAPTATLMEIIFDMSVNNKEILYVTDGETKLLGVIDRFSIVDKILVSAVDGR